MDTSKDGYRFYDKVVLVTGGADGIGRGCVDVFGKLSSVKSYQISRFHSKCYLWSDLENTSNKPHTVMYTDFRKASVHVTAVLLKHTARTFQQLDIIVVSGCVLCFLSGVY